MGERAPALLRRGLAYADERLEQTLFAGTAGTGLRFRNPLGLAAGFDKNGEMVRFWEAAGMGFVEVGSVTARPSAGNPRPRAFRLPVDRALVNRMGLNNDGVETVARRLESRNRRDGFVVGVNVAKTHDPTIVGDEALEDFRLGVRAALPVADYIALNVSCPNTADGKTFEEPEALDALLAVVAQERTLHPLVPVLVKLSPPGPAPASGAGQAGAGAGAVDELVAICLRHGVDGLIATNTASDRHGCATDRSILERIGRGGLSGTPIAARADEMTRHLYRLTGGALPIIGVGGIDSADEAYRRIRAGASLLQVYTGLVYEGPGLIRAINRGLARRLEADGLSSISEAVGVDA